VIKTRRFGYDGKGQAIIRDGDDPDKVWEDLGTKSAILEAFIAFEREISVIAARSPAAMSNVSTSPKTNTATTS